MPYFYDNKTEMCIPSYEMITIEGIPAIVIPSDDSYDNFTTLRFQRGKEKEMDYGRIISVSLGERHGE